jgi:hypothetical protein
MVRVMNPPVTTLAFPRDLLPFAFWPGWTFIGLWTGTEPGFWTAKLRGHRRCEPWQAQAARWLMAQVFGTPELPVRASRLQRFRNGWTFAVVSVATVGLTVLIYTGIPVPFDRWRI